MNDLVSVIIPTTDKETPFIPRCIYSVQTSTYKNVELVIINEQQERSEQRNLGIERAKGKYLLFLDSDQYISSRLIAECVDYMRIGYDSVYIPETIVTTGWFGRLRNWERQFYTGTAVDVVRFVRAELCPRFDVTLKGPEDSDWDRRIQGERTISRNVVYHDDNVTVRSFLAKKAYYSKSMGRFYEKWPDDKVLKFSYRCFWIFLESGKWRQFIARPLSAFMVMALIFARGLVYLCAKR